MHIRKYQGTGSGGSWDVYRGLAANSSPVMTFTGQGLTKTWKWFCACESTGGAKAALPFLYTHNVSVSASLQNSLMDFVC